MRAETKNNKQQSKWWLALDIPLFLLLFDYVGWFFLVCFLYFYWRVGKLRFSN